MSTKAALERHSRAAVTLELLGLRVRVETDDSVFLRALVDCYDSPALAVVEAEARLVVCVTDPLSEEERILAARHVESDPSGALQTAGWIWPVRTPIELSSALNQWAVSVFEGFAFHAAAVVRGGKGILLPAPSRAGKSTLTAALLTRGFELLSDEVAALDQAPRRIRPYPRNLALRADVLTLLGLDDPTPAASSHGSRMISPSVLGAKRAATPAKLGLVLAPRYEPGAPTRTIRLRPSHVLPLLLDCSCSLVRHKSAGLDWLIAMAREVPAYQLTFSELGEALRVVQELSEASVGNGPWESWK